MKLIIDISEDLYNNMKSRCKYQNETDNNLSVFEKIGIAVKNGTPLPKGHGKLIFEEDMLSVIMFSKLFDNAKVGEVKEAISKRRII